MLSMLNAGTIWVAADEEEMDEVRRKQKFYTDRKVPVEVLDEKIIGGSGTESSQRARRWVAGFQTTA